MTMERPPQLPPHLLEYITQMVGLAAKPEIRAEGIRGSYVKEIREDGALVVTPSREEAQRFDSAEEAWSFCREKGLDGFTAMFQPVVRRSRCGSGVVSPDADAPQTPS